MTFNSYTVFDKEGHLIMDERMAQGTPSEYFDGLSLDVQRQAHVLLVLQESGHVVRYMVEQPVAPAPTLGPREDLEAEEGL